MLLMFGPWIGLFVTAHCGLVPSAGPDGLIWSAPPFLGGFAAGWLVWWIQIPRSRLCAYGVVDDIAELKRIAVAVQLIWREGSFLERTEIAARKMRQGIRALELAKSRPHSGLFATFDR
jgi:hypothetical protein